MPVRLQEYGVGIFIGLSTKSAWKKALKNKLVLVDGKQAFTSTFIAGGERVEFKQSLIKSPARIDLKLQVLYEDEHMAAVHKPAGIEVGGNKLRTITNALQCNLEPSKEQDAVFPRPVHRLDFPTTGVLLVGKTHSAILALNKLFEERKIGKTYIAVTIGKMEAEGVIESPVDGKEAKSVFMVIESVKSERFGCLNLVALQPRTGRRHQLRKHLSEIGNPILGDSEYGLEELILKGKGLYLHASALEFEHISSSDLLVIESEIPDKFGKIFNDINF